jgi:hypothetical protein
MFVMVESGAHKACDWIKSQDADPNLIGLQRCWISEGELLRFRPPNGFNHLPIVFFAPFKALVATFVTGSVTFGTTPPIDGIARRHLSYASSVRLLQSWFTCWRIITQIDLRRSLLYYSVCLNIFLPQSSDFNFK